MIVYARLFVLLILAFVITFGQAVFVTHSCQAKSFQYQVTHSCCKSDRLTCCPSENSSYKEINSDNCSCYLNSGEKQETAIQLFYINKLFFNITTNTHPVTLFSIDDTLKPIWLRHLFYPDRSETYLKVKHLLI